MPDHITVETLTYEQIAQTIDHSLLKPELTEEEVIAGCKLALEYSVASVCVKPCDVALAMSVLAGTAVKVGTVISFPHGSSAIETKAFEARLAVEQGAEELDMVINIGRLRSDNDAYVSKDIAAVVEASAGRALVKVILENAYLTDEQKVHASQLVEKANAHFVKTSTGFAPSGATLADVRLMRQTVSPTIQIKAAHGVRTLDALLAMLNEGVTRVGATATQTILEDFKERKAKL